MNSIGIMQGRLSPTLDGLIQFFPFKHWEKEFKIAAEIGISEIEFIFDFDRYQENPLWSDHGTARLKQVIAETGVKVNFICADYFMVKPFFRNSEETRMDNIEKLKLLIYKAREIGARGIEIPLVDNSALKSPADEEIFINSLSEVLPLAAELNIEIGLETDLPPRKFASFLTKFHHPKIKANYDTGNSSGLGYDTVEELKILGKWINNVHIKDRVLHGGSVPLGQGNADLASSFAEFKKINYQGSFILQTARASDDVAEITKNKKIVEGYLSLWN